MTTTTLVPGTRTALTTTALNSLASATYVSAGTIDLSAIDPVECLIEVSVTPGTVSGNKQIAAFAKASTDNSNFTTGPESGTTTTDEPDLYLLGVLPVNTNSTAQTKIFSIANALGFVPPYCKIIIKNDSGAALAASGHGVHYTPVTVATA